MDVCARVCVWRSNFCECCSHSRHTNFCSFCVGLWVCWGQRNRIYVSDVIYAWVWLVGWYGACFKCNKFPIWMWPIVSGKSSFLIWDTKSHKFQWRRGLAITNHIHTNSHIYSRVTPKNSRTKATLETKQICQLLCLCASMSSTKEVFKLKTKHLK